MAGARQACHLKEVQINGKGRRVRAMSYGSFEKKQRKKKTKENRGVIRKVSWKKSITVKVKKSGIRDSGGKLKAGSPTILSTKVWVTFAH